MKYIRNKLAQFSNWVADWRKRTLQALKNYANTLKAKEKHSKVESALSSLMDLLGLASFASMLVTGMVTMLVLEKVSSFIIRVLKYPLTGIWLALTICQDAIRILTGFVVKTGQSSAQVIKAYLPTEVLNFVNALNHQIQVISRKALARLSRLLDHWFPIIPKTRTKIAQMISGFNSVANLYREKSERVTKTNIQIGLDGDVQLNITTEGDTYFDPQATYVKGPSRIEILEQNLAGQSRQIEAQRAIFEELSNLRSLRLVSNSSQMTNQLSSIFNPHHVELERVTQTNIEKGLDADAQVDITTESDTHSIPQATHVEDPSRLEILEQSLADQSRQFEAQRAIFKELTNLRSLRLVSNKSVVTENSTAEQKQELTDAQVQPKVEEPVKPSKWQFYIW